MESTHILAVALVALYGVVLVAGHHETTPEWKILLEDFKVWTGFYVRYNRPSLCYIVVHSVAVSPNGVAFATFKDKEGANMDFSIYDNPNDPTHTVTMKKTTSFKNTTTFPPHQDFMAVGKFTVNTSMRRASIYKANITLPLDKGFTTLQLSPSNDDEDNNDNTPYRKDRSMSLGLAIGIPVTLAVILVATGVGIGVWAVRKGYLRHVPLAYKNFRNPRDTQEVTFRREDQTTEAGHTVENGQAEQTEQNNVHM